METCTAVGTVVSEVEEQLRRRHYRNPPVVEAIARFQWSEPVAWSFTTPGLLFEHLRAEYPDEPKAQALVQAGMFSPEEGGLPAPAGVSAGFELRAGPQRIMFGRDDGTRLVAVSPTDLSVHGLQPYEGWESLRARLVQALDNAAPVIGRESAVSTVGLRYINRVEIPEPTLEFTDYLTIALGYPPGYPPQITGFLDRVEMQYPDENVKLAFTWASTEAPEGSVAFILDLDLYAQSGAPVGLEHAFAMLDDLKLKEGHAFEGLLLDRLREQFGEIE
ncbi:MAG: hypothetical protein QOI95_719 [Acidimicrobiaceae bacterium]